MQCKCYLSESPIFKKIVFFIYKKKIKVDGCYSYLIYWFYKKEKECGGEEMSDCEGEKRSVIILLMQL